MSIIPTDPEFRRTVAVVLATLAVVAIFATADSLLRAAFAMTFASTAGFLFQRGK